MNIRVTIDNEFVSVVTSAAFLTNMLEAGHTIEEVDAMLYGLERGATVRDGGGAAPIFAYEAVPSVVAVR